MYKCPYQAGQEAVGSGSGSFPLFNIEDNFSGNRRGNSISIAVAISAVVSVVLLVGAGLAGGACHCMTPMFSLFPYGSFVMEHFDSVTLGLPLALLQFPIYVVVLTLVKETHWKLIVLGFLIALHVLAATFAWRDYCESQRTCFFVARYPTIRPT